MNREQDSLHVEWEKKKKKPFFFIKSLVDWQAD